MLASDGASVQGLLDACAAGTFPADVAAVIAERPEAEALTAARRARVHALAKFKPRSQAWRAFDAELAELISTFHPDWIVAADWSRTLSAEFYDRFPGKVLTVFPALPGSFAGSHAVERAYYAYCRGELERTGVSVYRGATEGDGPREVLGKAELLIGPEDTLDSLESRARAAGADLLARVLEQVIRFPPERDNESRTV